MTTLSRPERPIASSAVLPPLATTAGRTDMASAGRPGSGAPAASAAHADAHETRQAASSPRPGFLYSFGRFVVAPVARVLYRPRVVGRRNVPKQGAVILASNHLSFIDSVVIPVVAPRRIQFLAKSHYFEGTGIVGWIKRTFFAAIGAVGVKRGAGRDSQTALEISRSILDAGSAFALYPEGTRSRDGRIYRGRTGVAWLALTTGAPVIPVGLIGTERLQPVGKRMPLFAPVTVAFGEPIDLSSFGPATSGKARREATDAVMAAIQKLSGQVEAGIYNEAPSDEPVA
ncbi:lysophospholipid acyltransferase family protein [Rathayibacter sp. CAU 1779]